MGEKELSVYKIEPSREQLEELGFGFEKDPKKPWLLIVTLPEGWKKVENNIIDSSDNVRGEYQNGHKIALRTYFMPMVESCGEKNNVCHVFFGNENERLFDAGEVDCSWYYDLASSDILSHYTIEQYGQHFSAPKEVKSDVVRNAVAKVIAEDVDALKAACVSYANAMYPGWDNVDTYWPKATQK